MFKLLFNCKWDFLEDKRSSSSLLPFIREALENCLLIVFLDIILSFIPMNFRLSFMLSFIGFYANIPVAIFLLDFMAN